MQSPVVVTGAAGFAGGHLVDHLIQQGHRIVAWHRPGGTAPFVSAAATADRGRTAGNRLLSWKAVDLLIADRVRSALEEAGPVAIYHCAGAPAVSGSWDRIVEVLRANVVATHTLLEAARSLVPDARILIPGSALVYRHSDGPLDENAPLGPNNPYGMSKLAQEMLGARAVQVDRQPVLVTRPFNHIGPRQSPTFAASSFAQQIALIEAGLALPVIEVGNLDAKRDLIDVRDTVRAYYTVMMKGAPGRVYNICSGRAYAIRDLLDQLLAESAADIEVRIDPSRLRPSDTPLVLGDPTRIENELGWAPQIPIADTLRSLLQYWRDRLASGVRPRSLGHVPS